MHKNYLLFMPSLISRDNPPKIVCRTDETDEAYYGLQTNIPASMLVLNKLADRGEKLNGIIMLCSGEVLNNNVQINGKHQTTYEYYTETVSERMRELGYNESETNAAFYKFPLNEINPGSWTSMDKVQNEMLSLISGDDNAAADEITLFVDYTGGLRSASMLLVFFAKLLESQGVIVEDVFYSNISNADAKTGTGEGRIESCMDTYHVFDYLNAFAAKSLDEFKRVFSQDENNDFGRLLNQTKEAQKRNQRGQYSQITESDREAVNITDEMDILHRIAAKQINEVRSSLTPENEINKLKRDNDFERALHRIKEQGLNMLINKGIITWTSTFYRSKDQIINAFYAYAMYYRSYLGFVHEMLLHLDFSKDPDELWTDFINYTEERYTLMPLAEPKGTISSAFEKEFDNRCSDIALEMKSELVRSIQGCADADSIVQIVDDYNRKRKCFISAYLNGGKGGFPFANILNRWSYSNLGSGRWYDDLYKDSLDKRMNIVCGLNPEQRSAVVKAIINDMSELAIVFPPIICDGLFTVEKSSIPSFGRNVLLMDSILTLKSDLCASSGQSFSSVVDSDIVTNSFGLPYIPARRIKGRLREAAEYIDSEIKDCLFGVKGSKRSGSLKIGSGYLKDREALEAVLTARNDFSKQKVTEFFTDIKAQTAILGDTVKDSSLRFTRTLSHYLPYKTTEETSFVFSVSGISDDDREEFERICKALRHIGLMRTRGLGFVRAEYQHGYSSHSNAEVKVLERNGKYYLPLHLLLTEPLLIASRDNTECVNYVPGTAVLGAFARLAVLNQMDETDFDKLFLSGKVRFGNLYISDKSGAKALPAPHFMRKLKSTDAERDGKIVTEYDDYDRGVDTPKTLKDKYVAISNLRKVMKVSTETQYHHTKGSDSGLYTQDAISAGQYLYGEVEGTEKAMMEKLASLLESGDFRLGRSRTAQYSGCKLIECKTPDAKKSVGKSGKIVFALESDAVLTDSEGVNTIAPEALKAELKIPDDKDAEFNLGYKVIHGYNSKRNMRNIPAVAFAMGSTVKVDFPNVSAGELTIGIRNSEGFGRVKVYSEDDIVNKPINKTIPLEEAAVTSEDDDKSKDTVESAIAAFNAFLDNMLIAAKANGKAERTFAENSAAFSKTKLNAAFVGTVSRMIETAGDTEEAIKRIEKIKDEVKKEKIMGILNAALPENAPDKIKRDSMLTVLRLAKYQLRLEKKGGETDE